MDDGNKIARCYFIGAKIKDILNRLKEDIVVSQTSLYLLIEKLEVNYTKHASRPSILNMNIMNLLTGPWLKMMISQVIAVFCP